MRFLHTANDNSARQTLHLNVYRMSESGGLTTSVSETHSTNSPTEPTANSLANIAGNALRNEHGAIQSVNPGDLSDVHPTTILRNRRRFIGQFNHLSACGTSGGRLEADLIVNQTVAINQTNEYIRFRRFKLSKVQSYLFIIFASNARGRSEMLEFEWTLDSGRRFLLFQMFPFPSSNSFYRKCSVKLCF